AALPAPRRPLPAGAALPHRAGRLPADGQELGGGGDHLRHPLARAHDLSGLVPRGCYTWRMEEPRYPYVHLFVPAERAELASLELFELGAQGVEERDESTMLTGEGG